jgi:hypothetical protein
MKQLLLTSLLLAAIAAGCSTGRIDNARATLPEESSAGALDRISDEMTVNQNDAMHLMLLLADGQDEADHFQQRVMKLRDREVIPTWWDVDAEAPITRGQLAYMVYQTAKMPGGLTLSVFGPSQRYCLRELQYNGTIAPGGVFSPVTGMEIVAVLNRADSYMQEGQAPEVLNPRGE